MDEFSFPFMHRVTLWMKSLESLPQPQAGALYIITTPPVGFSTSLYFVQTHIHNAKL